LIDISRGRAATARAEEVFEPPATLQSVIDCGNQRRPPRAGLEGLGTFSADNFGKPGFARGRDGGVTVPWGQEGGVEVSADPPPQHRSRVIIRQRPAVGCRTQQLSGVDPSSRDCGQAAGQNGCKTVVPYGRWDLFDQWPPFPPCGCYAVGHRLVEAALPYPGSLVSLNGTGGAPVIRADGHCGPPYLDVLDRLAWWLAFNRPSPRRSLMSTDAGPEPLGQLADGCCSTGQIATPDLMLLELLGNRG
jgi:hypothetical protein